MIVRPEHDSMRSVLAAGVTVVSAQQFRGFIFVSNGIIRQPKQAKTFLVKPVHVQAVERA